MDQKLQTAIEITRDHLSRIAKELHKTSDLQQQLYMALFSATQLGAGSSVIEGIDSASRLRLHHVIAEEISTILGGLPGRATS